MLANYIFVRTYTLTELIFFLPVREILFSRFIFTLASGRVHIYNSVKASTFVRACAYANVAFGLKISHPLSPYGEIGFSADSLAVGQENKKIKNYM